MIGTEERPPAVEQRFTDGPAARAVSFGVQITGGVQDEVTAGAQYVQALRDYWLARSALEALVDGWFEGASNSAARSLAGTSSNRPASEATHD